MQDRPASTGRLPLAARMAADARSIVALTLAASLGAARAGDEIVTTPAGERVKLEHLLHPGGVVLDFHENVDGGGHRVRHGVYKRHFRNGEMKELITCAHGEEDGPFIIWREDGVKALDVRYSHGRLQGLITRCYPDGTKRRELGYVNGVLEGPFVTLYENGYVRPIGTHRRGQRNGPYVEYHPNGEMYQEGAYARGYLNGKITLFTESGEPEATGKLNKEEIVGDWVCLAREGRPARKRPECRGKSFWECPC